LVVTRPRGNLLPVRVFDCFTFFNELDLLEIRLRLLEDVVDRFVLVEADRTFSNQPKPMWFAENRPRFARWDGRITYVRMEHDATGLDFSRPSFYTPTLGPWFLERRQRDGFAVINAELADDDVVLVSDVDEVPSPESVREAVDRFVRQPGRTPGYVFRQLMHHYYLNMQSTGLDRVHLGTCAVHGEFFRGMAPNLVRRARWPWPRIGAAGWHFSFLGLPDEIAYKIQSYSHQEFNHAAVIDANRVARVVHEGRGVTDHFGYYYEQRPLSTYPPALAAIMADYPHLLCDEPTAVSRYDLLRRGLRTVSRSERAMDAVVRAKIRVGYVERGIRSAVQRARPRRRSGMRSPHGH
jgi:beta-1,4-mannosyl-glycoprotein beta-1,4-N-acetylglucosaminyltransferase